MAKSLSEFRKQISPEVQTAARAKAVATMVEMSLAETRKSRGFAQGAVACRMNVAQPNISQIESRPDLLLSTLSQYVEALGGRLELHARFPDGQDVEITQFKTSASL
jgi:hypothetical protein